MLTSQFGTPGQSDAIFSKIEEILWGGDVTRIPLLQKQNVIDGSSRNTASPRPAVLIQGTLLSRVTATGKLKPYDPTASGDPDAVGDGTEEVYGVLGVELLTQNVLTGGDEDKVAPIVVLGPVKASKLLIGGAPFVGHPDEDAARASLTRRGAFFLDDEF